MRFEELVTAGEGSPAAFVFESEIYSKQYFFAAPPVNEWGDRKTDLLRRSKFQRRFAGNAGFEFPSENEIAIQKDDGPDDLFSGWAPCFRHAVSHRSPAEPRRLKFPNNLRVAPW